MKVNLLVAAVLPLLIQGCDSEMYGMTPQPPNIATLSDDELCVRYASYRMFGESPEGRKGSPDIERAEISFRKLKCSEDASYAAGSRKNLAIARESQKQQQLSNLSNYFLMQQQMQRQEYNNSMNRMRNVTTTCNRMGQSVVCNSF